MPNWVYNTIRIEGEATDIQEFKDFIDVMPRLAGVDDDKWEGSSRFSFHSFITPPDKVTTEEYHASHGSGPSGPFGDGQYNWYNWNNDNWNTKWDACSATVMPSDSNTKLTITFETAWAPPEPVLVAMTAKYPTLDFDFWWEEEQGFGAELEGRGGIVTQTKSWDTPASHADYQEQDKECVCSHEDNPEYWYDDCPGKARKQVFTVETITKRYVLAFNEEDAMEAARAEESGYDLPVNTEVQETLYAEEYRVVEITETEEDN